MTAQPTGRTALVLGSGGARGWCHIGVLRGIDALGLRPDMLIGCSMGALVGAAWAAGRLDALEDFARSLTRSRVLRMLDLRPGSGGLIGGGGISHLLGSLGLSGSFSDLSLPFTAVAADLNLGQEIWLQRGDLAPAIRASAAMPGILAPQWLEGRWLIDGAVVNPVPVSVARAMGAVSVVAVNPTTRVLRPTSHPLPPEGEAATAPAPSRFARLIPLRSDKLPRAAPPAPGYLSLVAQALDIMSERIRRSRLAGDPPDLLIGARLQDLSALDFHRAAEAIDEGHRIAELHRDVLREWLRPSASTTAEKPPPKAPPSAAP
ncbi:patatin-like phospholipase family protein [Falsigemmobacter intermedius]|uniref:PNPLA domain-containing protein n=1 Tax=Falsigemmobacter intermedius TaxID=1553448 RepID=A0A3S3UAC9_9RHOB|nr:patatin-like phospholipase family protein [Falsigemmobacter intermedius]RWY42476.1 hypothetical protein EP867_07020 [Falsigemmobacter intermedius]